MHVWYRNHIQSEEKQSQKYLKGNGNTNGKGLTVLLSYLIPKMRDENNLILIPKMRIPKMLMRKTPTDL